jgi:hypothetical protein
MVLAAAGGTGEYVALRQLQPSHRLQDNALIEDVLP